MEKQKNVLHKKKLKGTKQKDFGLEENSFLLYRFDN